MRSQYLAQSGADGICTSTPYDAHTSRTKPVVKISISDWIVAIIPSTASNIYGRVSCALLTQQLSLQRRVRQASWAGAFKDGVEVTMSLWIGWRNTGRSRCMDSWLTLDIIIRYDANDNAKTFLGNSLALGSWLLA